MDVLGRGLRGEGLPSPNGGVLETMNSSFEGSMDLQAKLSILGPIRFISRDLGSNRHFGSDLELQEALVQPICFSHQNKIQTFIYFWEGGRVSCPRPARKSKVSFYWAGGQIQAQVFLAGRGEGW